MVTKHTSPKQKHENCSVLAKIHMVTKRWMVFHYTVFRSVLAKIHMVTKPQKHAITF